MVRGAHGEEQGEEQRVVCEATAAQRVARQQRALERRYSLHLERSVTGWRQGVTLSRQERDPQAQGPPSARFSDPGTPFGAPSRAGLNPYGVPTLHAGSPAHASRALP